MTLSPNIIIIVPCYNEEKGIINREYSNFLSDNPDINICFVNDCSTDNTLFLINTLKKQHHYQIEIISLKNNVGKAEAVRAGIKYCNLHFQHQFIGYLDADLATSLQEFSALKDYMSHDIVFCFGSRIRKIGSTIERKNSRFLIGRVVATIISNILNIKVYDTQCGSKLFTKDIASQLFKEKFISRWLFDVELFYRMILLFNRDIAIKKMCEVPLKLWIDKGDSKVKVSYFFMLWYDLFKIYSTYRKMEQNSNVKTLLK